MVMRVFDWGDIVDIVEVMVCGVIISCVVLFSCLDGLRSEGMRGEGEDFGLIEEGWKCL